MARVLAWLRTKFKRPALVAQLERAAAAITELTVQEVPPVPLAPPVLPVLPVRPVSVAGISKESLWAVAEVLPLEELDAFDATLGAHGYDPNGLLRQRVRARLAGEG